MSAFFCKKLAFFFPKKYLYSKQQSENCVRDFLLLFSVFVRKRVTITENITFTDSVSGIWPSDCSELTKNKKNDNEVTIFRHDVNVKFFSRYFVFLVKFSYWSKFHVNIITGSGVMKIFFYKGSPEIRKSELPPSELCPIPGDWDKLWIPNLARI